MSKKIITKKTLFFESKVLTKLFVGFIFLLVSILIISVNVFSLYSNDYSKSNIVITICFNVALFLIFGVFIGLKQILSAIFIIGHINSKKFIIETDEVIDKYCFNISDSSGFFKVVFKYNDALIPNREWEKTTIGSKYYIFNLSKKITIVKKCSSCKLDDDLQTKLVDYHINNEENTVENWEE